MGDGKLIIISITVSGINDRIRFYPHRLTAQRVTDLVERQDEEGAAAGRLGDNGEKARVDGAVGRLPAALGDADVVVALLFLQRLSEHVAELALAHDAERHGDVTRCAVTWSRGRGVTRSGGGRAVGLPSVRH